MNNKLNAIATFTRRRGGFFSAAARQSRMKQSAVSQQIAALEEELGVVLLHRTTRVMALTEQGKATGVICSFARGHAGSGKAVEPCRSSVSGPGTCAVAERSGADFMPHLLALQKRNPGLHLMLSLDDRIADLVTEGVDVARG